MGSTPDEEPHVGKVPGRNHMWIFTGFNGGGNALTFLCAKGVAKMVLEGVSLGESGAGMPSSFESTEERLGLPAGSRLAIDLNMSK